MAKRMMVTSLIVLGIAAFLIAGFFLVLFLAPGFQAFGLMYISKGARAYASGEVRILTEMEKLGYDSFSGSITLEVDECPVYVEFSQKYDYIVEYYENYSGLTKTNMGVLDSCCVNSYSESEYSTSVVLNGCNFINCGTRTYGPNSSLVKK